MTVNEVAVITGGSSGIGFEFALQLAQRGHNLLLVARNHEELHQAAEHIRMAFKVQVETIAVDLSDENNIQLVAEAIKKYNRISYLVNNAGTTYLGDFHEVALEKHKKLLNLHVLAPVHITHSALDVMLKSKAGTIINVASFSAFMERVPTNGLYGPTKSFLVSFSRTLRYTLAAQNIYVQVLCPGYTYSNFHKSEEFKSQGLDVYKKVPKFMWMSSKDVVNASLNSRRRDFIVIPGVINKLFLFVMNLSIMGSFFKRKK